MENISYKLIEYLGGIYYKSGSRMRMNLGSKCWDVLHERIWMVLYKNIIVVHRFIKL